MVRQYKIHTDLDGVNNKIIDVTNGKVRFYQPSNLGLMSDNNIWQTQGIGTMGTRSITQPEISFKLETFGDNLKENYELMRDFVNDILSVKFVTLEYSTECFQVFADLAMKEVTKTEGYGKNGTFSETITFDVITKWYTYENLSFNMIKNGEVIEGKSKIYGGEAPHGHYNYVKNESYTYYGEENIERLSRWEIKDEIFSVVARLDPTKTTGDTGIRFLDTLGNEYTAIVFDIDSTLDYILINTDVNDEVYQGWSGTSAVNLFPVIDFERYRTRIIQKGQMQLINLRSAEFKIKRKADFI